MLGSLKDYHEYIFAHAGPWRARTQPETFLVIKHSNAVFNPE